MSQLFSALVAAFWSLIAGLAVLTLDKAAGRLRAR